MRRFLIRMALFWLIQAGIFLAFHRLYVRRTDDYLAATRDKEHRLADLAGPRVVFVGGSNLAFGLDSSIVERWTGRRAVNMGLYAALGVRYMLDEARGSLRPGDVVVIALEYDLFLSESHLRGSVMDWERLFLVNPSALRHAPAGSLRRAMVNCADGLRLPGQIVRVALRAPHLWGCYNRHSFNEHGDVQTRRERTPDMPPLLSPKLTRNPAITGEAVELLADFVAECRRRGIDVYLTMPDYPRPDYEANAPILEEIQTVLRRSVAAPILVDGLEATLPRDRFYDTTYHLDNRGARERSELLGRRLAQILGSQIVGGPSSVK